MSFGLKKTDKNIASTNVGLNSINSVVKGTILNGEITSETDIRIDGEINGNINCKATTRLSLFQIFKTPGIRKQNMSVSPALSVATTIFGGTAGDVN